MRAGDDLIGPRDIKRGVHLLTNAEMAILNIEEEEEETGVADEEAPEASDAPAKPKKQHKDSSIVRGDKLSEEQLTQVCTPDHLDPSMTGCLWQLIVASCRQ